MNDIMNAVVAIIEPNQNRRKVVSPSAANEPVIHDIAGAYA